MRGDEDDHWEPCPVCGGDELSVEFEDVNVAGVWFVRVTIRCDDCVTDTTGPRLSCARPKRRPRRMPG
jgi:hypothetical protein